MMMAAGDLFVLPLSRSPSPIVVSGKWTPLQSAKRSTDFLRWMIFDLEREHFIGQSLFRGGAELKSMDHHIVDLKRTDHHETFQIDLSPIWLNHNQFIRVEKGDEIGR